MFLKGHIKNSKFLRAIVFDDAGESSVATIGENRKGGTVA